MRLKKKLELYDLFHPHFLYDDPNDPTLAEESFLRKKALPFEIPLSNKDKNDIIKFMLYFENRDKKELSLAAPQIGIPKRLIAFSVPIGRGVVQTFPKTVWLNPTYEMVTDETEEEYEICPSTAFAVPIKRYRRINYKAYDVDKKTIVEGEARGAAARIIQHETDHLDGILSTDLAPKEQFITIEEYREKRKARWNGKGWMDCIQEIRDELKQMRDSYPSAEKPKKKQRRLIKALRVKEATRAAKEAKKKK